LHWQILRRRQVGVNLPNQLTITRIVLIPFFVLCLHAWQFASNPVIIAVCFWLALLLFIIAAITDYLDGSIARKRNIVTNFGKLFDPLADKLLTMAAFVAFVEMRAPDGHPIFPAWAIILILAREYLVTGLRSVALTNGTVIHADKWGKQKTIWQLIGIIVVLVCIAARQTLLSLSIPTKAIDPAMPIVFKGFLAIIVVLTVLSGLMFLFKNWGILTDHE